MTNETKVHITPSMMCKIIEKETGEKVSPETHWLKSSIESTRDNPPYALVTFHAIRR